jgi:hypothetical protein
VSFLNLGLQLLPQHLVDEAITDLEGGGGGSASAGTSAGASAAASRRASTDGNADAASQQQQQQQLGRLMAQLAAPRPAAAQQSPASGPHTPLASAAAGPGSVADSFSSTSPYKGGGGGGDAFSWAEAEQGQAAEAAAAAAAGLLELHLQRQAGEQRAAGHHYGGSFDAAAAAAAAAAGLQLGCGNAGPPMADAFGSPAAAAMFGVGGSRRCSMDAGAAALVHQQQQQQQQQGLAAAILAGGSHRGSMDLAAGQVQALLGGAASRRGSMDVQRQHQHQHQLAQMQHHGTAAAALQSALLAEQLAAAGLQPPQQQHRGSFDLARPAPARPPQPPRCSASTTLWRRWVPRAGPGAASTWAPAAGSTWRARSWRPGTGGCRWTCPCRRAPPRRMTRRAGSRQRRWRRWQPGRCTAWQPASSPSTSTCTTTR